MAFTLLYFTLNALLKYFNILQYSGIKTLPARNMKCCYLKEKKLLDYLRFQKGLTGYYMVFLNYIVASAFTGKVLQLQFLSNWQHKSKAFQDQNINWKIYHPLYYIPLPKNQKEFFAAHKILRVLKLPRAFMDRVFFRFQSDRVLFRFLSDRVLVIRSSLSPQRQDLHQGPQ